VRAAQVDGAHSPRHPADESAGQRDWLVCMAGTVTVERVTQPVRSSPLRMRRDVRLRPHHFRWPLGLAVVLPIVGCDVLGTGRFVDFEDFDEIPPIEMLDYASVQPGRVSDIWELRRLFRGVRQEVIGGGGTISRGEIDPDLLTEFDSVEPSSGFGVHCVPVDCFLFIASLRGRTVEVWQSAEDVRSFLEPIDTQEDAILLVLARGYTWGGAKEAAAVRTVGARYELVVLRMVSYCTPVQTDRYLLEVTQDGQVIELKSDVWDRSDGCI
jgi:hypothetical protein